MFRAHLGLRYRLTFDGFSAIPQPTFARNPRCPRCYRAPIHLPLLQFPPPHANPIHNSAMVKTALSLGSEITSTASRRRPTADVSRDWIQCGSGAVAGQDPAGRTMVGGLVFMPIILAKSTYSAVRITPAKNSAVLRWGIAGWHHGGMRPNVSRDDL